MGEQIDLSARKCVPCEGGVPPLSSSEAEAFLAHLSGWSIEGGHLSKTYPFRDFSGALRFVNRVGKVAEKNAHHPDVHLAWGRVRLEIWTHAIDGLSEGDFVLAAKCDKAFDKQARKEEGKEKGAAPKKGRAKPEAPAKDAKKKDGKRRKKGDGPEAKGKARGAKRAAKASGKTKG